MACWASLSMERSRQKYWSGLLFPSGDHPMVGCIYFGLASYIILVCSIMKIISRVFQNSEVCSQYMLKSNSQYSLAFNGNFLAVNLLSM